MDAANDPVAAAVLFRASGSISEALPCPTPEEVKLRRIYAYPYHSCEPFRMASSLVAAVVHGAQTGLLVEAKHYI